jgi:predicted site-specific integrase-resolvase
MSELVDAKELAKRLKVTPATIHAWHRRGWIPCLRAGRRPVLFDDAEVQSALRRRAERKGVGDAGA